MTLWLFILGRIFTNDVDLQIPYLNIVLGMVGIVLPGFCGLLVRRYKPKAGKFLSKLAKPFSGIFIAWVFIVGSLTNMYIYEVMVNVWYVIPAGFALPFCGMLMGFGVALAFRQSLAKTIAISIETGVQDTGISILLLLASFPKPEGSIAAIIPVTVAIFTTIPLLVAFAIRQIILRCDKSKPNDESTYNVEDEVDERAALPSNGVSGVASHESKLINS